MEEAYWKQFMTTGKIEDYLQFKEVSNIEGEMSHQNMPERNRRERPDAGFGKCDSHCT